MITLPSFCSCPNAKRLLPSCTIVTHLLIPVAPIKKGGRDAAVVVSRCSIVTHLLMPVAKLKKRPLCGRSVPRCPKETHYLLMPVAPTQKGGRLTAVVVSSRPKIVTHLLMPVAHQFKKKVVTRPYLFSSNSHHLSNRDPSIDTSFPIKEGGRFAAVVPNCPEEIDPFLIIDASCTNNFKNKGGASRP